MSVVVGAIVFVLLTLIVGQYGLRLLYGYQISEEGIEVVLFGSRPIIKMRFNEIAEIRKCSYSETLPLSGVDMLTAIRLGNRIWGETILVRRRHGLLKNVLITPDKANQFIREAQDRLASACARGGAVTN